MSNRSIVMALGLSVLTLAAGAQPSTAQDALKSQREAYVTAFNAQDATRIAELYAGDATFLPFTGQIVKGSAAIAPAMARVASQVKLDLQPLSGAASGALAYESGTWTHVDRSSGATLDGGAYLWVWRQDANGKWTIVSHGVSRTPPAK